MILFKSGNMKIITDPRCTEYSKPGHPETPERVIRTLEKLRVQKGLSLSWGDPLPVDEAVILRAHTPELLGSLDQIADFDSDTPALVGAGALARQSIGGALAALQSTIEGETGFSLLRPPGHHASQSKAMGFCYLNAIAVAVLEARVRGFKRIAVLDFDAHHGNGTEEILLDQPGIAFASVHQFPEYPWTGAHDRGTNCFNFPVPPESTRQFYLDKLSKALARLKEFKPDLIAVSAGFDSYKEDPLSEQHLEIEDYHWLGESIRNFGIPTFGILEGGYSDAMPELVYAYLCGLNGEKPML